MITGLSLHFKSTKAIEQQAAEQQLTIVFPFFVFCCCFFTSKFYVNYNLIVIWQHTDKITVTNTFYFLECMLCRPRWPRAKYQCLMKYCGIQWSAKLMSLYLPTRNALIPVAWIFPIIVYGNVTLIFCLLINTSNHSCTHTPLQATWSSVSSI